MICNKSIDGMPVYFHLSTSIEALKETGVQLYRDLRLRYRYLQRSRYRTAFVTQRADGATLPVKHVELFSSSDVVESLHQCPYRCR
jgi:hypothetical protein